MSALLERRGDARKKGFGQLEGLLNDHAGRLDQRMAELAHLSCLRYDEVLKISAQLDELVSSYRAVPEEQRSAHAEVVYKIGLAETLAGLRHPASVPVLDCDYADREKRQRPYIVMESTRTPCLRCGLSHALACPVGSAHMLSAAVSIAAAAAPLAPGQVQSRISGMSSP